MKRFANWTTLMNVAIDRKRPLTALAWGVADCFLVPADIVWEFTGEDFAAPFRGRYHDADSAYALLQEFSGGGLLPTLSTLAETHGWQEVDPRYAQRGDVLLLRPMFTDDKRFGGVTGIVVGKFACAMGANGLSMMPLRSCQRAWHIE